MGVSARYNQAQEPALLEHPAAASVPYVSTSAREAAMYEYPIKTDPKQAHRASEIRLFSGARPHMRAFHYAWFSFFIAFFGWFSIPPLLPTIKRELRLTPDQVANSNIASVSSTIIGRLIVGPMCDRYGARVVQASLLVLGALPVAATALVTNYVGFVIVRFFIGLVGCSFVATAFWTSSMFTNEIVGSANALAAGWGNLGAGVTYLLTPFLFDLVTANDAVSDDLGWRITLVFPAVFMFIVGVCLYFFSDDCPHGNYSDIKKLYGIRIRAPQTSSMWAAMLQVSKKPVVWILAFQYACSFGVEIQVHNVLSLYYFEDFTRSDCDPSVDATKCRLLSQTTTGVISSLFGLMCIFARAAGGYASDVASRRIAMRGRIAVQLALFAAQAVSLLVFSRIRTLAPSIPFLILFGVFVQACTGSTYGIVPYVAPEFTGITSGIVGAGGNAGALAWGFVFKAVGARDDAFLAMSAFVAVATLLCGAMHVRGEGSLWRNERDAFDRATECVGDETSHGQCVRL